MIVRKPVHRFLKWIGAYTISDEDLALSEVYESLPSDEREIIDRVLMKSQTIEAAGRRMGLTAEQARDLYERARERVGELTSHIPWDEPDH